MGCVLQVSIFKAIKSFCFKIPRIFLPSRAEKISLFMGKGTTGICLFVLVVRHPSAKALLPPWPCSSAETCTWLPTTTSTKCQKKNR